MSDFKTDSSLDIQSETINGLQRHLYLLINESIAKNDSGAFEQILSFVTQTIFESIENKNAAVFHQLVRVPVWCYEENLNNLTYKNLLLAKINVTYRDLLRFKIKWSLKEGTGIEEKKQTNEFIYLAHLYYINFLNRLVFHKQYTDLIIALEEFNKLSDNGEKIPYAAWYEIKDLYKSNDIASGAELKFNVKVDHYFDVINQQAVFIFQSWVWYMFSLDEFEIDDKTVIDITAKLGLRFEYIEDFLEEALYIREQSHWGYFGIMDWDYVERLSEKVYSPPQPHTWIALGITIYLLRNPYLNDVELNLIKNNDGIYTIFGEIKANLAYLKDSFEKWRKIILCEDKNDFEDRSRKIINLFSQLRRRYLSIEEKSIATYDISPELIEKFQLLTAKAWQRGSKIKMLFESFNNFEISFDSQKKFKRFGSTTFFEKAKTMFTAQDYHHIYGIEDMGAQLGRGFDYQFFQAILPLKKTTNYDSLILALDRLIAQLMDAGRKPNLIVMPPEFLMLEELQKHPEFVSRWMVKEKIEIEHIGRYKGIAISQTYSGQMKNRLMVCVFEDAFKLEILHNVKCIPNDAEISVHEVSTDEAKIRLEKDREKWSKDSEGNILSEEEAITLIKTSVIIKMYFQANFLVKDLSSYEIAEISPNIMKQLN